MKALYATLITLLSIALCVGIPSAQYWFQSGAVGTYNSSQNSGAAVTIETVYQNTSVGSFGFWVGETLSNGAFVQVGYEVENQSGYYPTDCNLNGCNGSVYISAGIPTWFWEYFPSNYNGSSFLGGIGPNDSAGQNGSFNTYSMNSSGDVWSFYFNGQKIGSANMGTANSGANPPSALGELAEVYDNSQYMNPVEFKNLKYFDNGEFIQVPVAYSTISYGKGSDTLLPNLYGVEEVGSYTNVFRVGSGIPLNNQSRLWSIGYRLAIISDYGNISSNNNYSGSAIAYISAPKYFYINNTVREMFVGWSGTGYGSYSGTRNNSSVLMADNITETAHWQKQYYVNVSSEYGVAGGSGWYDNGSTLALSAYPKILSEGIGVREVFTGWNSAAGAINSTSTISVNSPMTINAIWTEQYLVNVTSSRGVVSGNGWYNSGSTAHITLSNYTKYISNNSRISFEKWSNGLSTANFTTVVSGPVLLSASFGTQYLVSFAPRNAHGSSIDASYVEVSGNTLPVDGAFMFPGTYELRYVKYKGINVSVNENFSVTGPSVIPFDAQIYNVSVYARSMLGGRVNASAMLTFENGTVFSGYLGPNGSISFTDVPYGYVGGYLYYNNMKEQVAAGYGSNVTVTFIDPVTFTITLGVIIVAIAISVHTYRSRKLRR